MKGRAVFVDTGAWVALRYRRDGMHARSRSLLRKLRREKVNLVTSDLVVVETVTLLKARGAVDHAIALGEALQGGVLGRVVEHTPERSRRAWALFVRHRALRSGFVDCASFGIMDELGLDTVFGFDDDFVRAGFLLYS